jgi:hypothetical protein
MTNDDRRDQPDQPDSSTRVNKEEPVPVQPQPSGQVAPPAETPEHVKTDAVIEDRFEATDN